MSDRSFPVSTDVLEERIYNLTDAIILLAQYIDRINANSNSPFSDDVEEEIKKILG